MRRFCKIAVVASIWSGLLMPIYFAQAAQTHLWGGSKSATIAIGYRHNMRSGERSAIRWLSRFMKEQPEVSEYKILYQARKNGKITGFIVAYNRSQKTLARVELGWTPPRGDKHGPKTTEDDWYPIEANKVHEVAKQSGTMKSFGSRHIRTVWGS